MSAQSQNSIELASIVRTDKYSYGKIISEYSGKVYDHASVHECQNLRKGRGKLSFSALPACCCFFPVFFYFLFFSLLVRSRIHSQLCCGLFCPGPQLWLWGKQSSQLYEDSQLFCPVAPSSPLAFLLLLRVKAQVYGTCLFS